MSVLLWWLPALLVVIVAWWRLRPKPRRDDEDMRALRRIVRGDQ